jgi:hypothetical protein
LLHGRVLKKGSSPRDELPLQLGPLRRSYRIINHNIACTVHYEARFRHLREKSRTRLELETLGRSQVSASRARDRQHRHDLTLAHSNGLQHVREINSRLMKTEPISAVTFDALQPDSLVGSGVPNLRESVMQVASDMFKVFGLHASCIMDQLMYQSAASVV